jgi:hypothetical protein
MIIFFFFYGIGGSPFGALKGDKNSLCKIKKKKRRSYFYLFELQKKKHYKN